MKNYAQRLVQICHRRGAFAIGGMAAFTPGKTAERREQQTVKVVSDKKWEANLGHDGCWVSHPYFIGPAMSAFPRDHQLDVVDPDFDLYPDLLPVSTPPRTMAGLRTDVRVGIGYLNGWNQGIGCVAWDDLMEDLATLEISRAQTWQKESTCPIERDWESNPRWAGVERAYDSEQVKKLRGSVLIRHTLAELGAGRLWKLSSTPRTTSTPSAR